MKCNMHYITERCRCADARCNFHGESCGCSSFRYDFFTGKCNFHGERCNCVSVRSQFYDERCNCGSCRYDFATGRFSFFSERSNCVNARSGFSDERFNCGTQNAGFNFCNCFLSFTVIIKTVTPAKSALYHKNLSIDSFCKYFLTKPSNHD